MQRFVFEVIMHKILKTEWHLWRCLAIPVGTTDLRPLIWQHASVQLKIKAPDARHAVQ